MGLPGRIHLDEARPTRPLTISIIVDLAHVPNETRSRLSLQRLHSLARYVTSIR